LIARTFVQAWRLHHSPTIILMSILTLSGSVVLFRWGRSREGDKPVAINRSLRKYQ
jgi:hypothetical protein